MKDAGTPIPRWRRRLGYLVRPHVALSIALHARLGIPASVWIVNVLFQRLGRLNGDATFQVNFSSRVLEPARIQLGRGVWKSFAVSGNCYIQAGNGIVFGDDVLFAPGVKIISANHDPDNLAHWVPAPPVRIGHRSWIGAGAILLPGVELGDDCIVGAGAVVTRSTPPGSVVVGNPARLLRQRAPSSTAASA